jgi:hypothetical protein
MRPILYFKNTIKIVLFPFISYILLFKIQLGKLLSNFDFINSFNKQIIDLIKPIRKPKILFDFDTLGLSISEISLLLIFLSIVAYIYLKNDKFFKLSIIANVILLFVLFVYGLVLTFYYLE